MNAHLTVITALVFGLAQALSPDFNMVSGNEVLQNLIRQAEAHENAGANKSSLDEVSPSVPLPEAPAGPLDAIIDFVLAGAVPQIISHGKAALPLPDFNFHVNTTIGGEFRVVGGVSASGGSVQDIKSLFRQGPTVLRRAPAGVLLLDAAAGMRLVRLSYSKYVASLNGPLASGQIQVQVAPAAMSAQIALVPPCSVQLRQLQVSQLGALNVSITGLPPAFSILPKMVESLFDNQIVRQKVISTIVQRVSAIISQEFNRLSCK